MFRPPIILAGRIANANPSKGDRSFNVGSVTTGTGSWFNIEADMTMYVGSTPRGTDKGRIRIRSAGSPSSPTLIVAENEDIEWTSGTYVTIVNFYEAWGVYPRITGGENPQFYKDYDVAYTNQNTLLDPVPIMGPPYAGFAEGGGSGTVWFDGSGSYCPDGSSISSYAWEFPGGSPSTYNGIRPGYVAYSPGHYMSHLTVTASNGKSYKGHRPVLVYDHFGSGTFTPISRWGPVSDVDGDYVQGGYRTDIWVRETASETGSFVDGGLGIIFAEDFYQGMSTGTSLGGVYGRQHIIFVGNILKSSLQIDPTTSQVRFSLVTVNDILRNSEMFPITLESKSSPATWNEFKYPLTVDEAVHHYLRWQSTVYRSYDVFRNNDTQPFQFADWARGPMYEAIDNFLQSTLFAKMVCDRQGRVFTEKNLNRRLLEDRTASTVMELTRADWLNALGIEQRIEKEVSFIEINGLGFSGGTVEDNIPLISYAPGRAPHYRGKSQRIPGLVLSNQTQSNKLAGKVIAHLNNEFPNVEIPLSGNYRVFDIAPQEYVEITTTPSENYRGLTWTRKRFIPIKVRYKLDVEKQMCMAGMLCEAETDGPDGVTGDYPSDPPVTPPPPPPPPLPPVPPTPPPDDVIDGDGNLVYVVSNPRASGETLILARTRNFLSVTPNWENVTGAVTQAVEQEGSLILDPFDVKNIAFYINSAGIWRTQNLDSSPPTWTLVLSSAAAAALVSGASGFDGKFIQGSNLAFGTFYAVGASTIGTSLTPLVVKTVDGGNTWTGVRMTTDTPASAPFDDWDSLSAMFVSTHDSNKLWIAITGQSGGTSYKTRIYRSINGASSFTNIWDTGNLSNFPRIVSTLEVPFNDNSADSVMYIVWGPTSGAGALIYRSTNGGSSWADITPSISGSFYSNGEDGYFSLQAYTINRLQLICMARLDNGNTVYYFTSNDGGTTWTPVLDFSSATGNTLVFNIGQWPIDFNRVFVFANGNQIAGRTEIYYTENGGLTWTLKNGDWLAVFGFTAPIAAPSGGWHNIVPVTVA
jgi:hypothetical protein